MKFRQVAAVAAASALVLIGLGATTASAAAPSAQSLFPGLTTECSSNYFDNDYRLGPDQLPEVGNVGFELLGYNRTGGLTEQQLFAQYYNTATSSWIYPPDNGYLIVNGQPIEYQTTLAAGQRIDRFGSEYGSFLAPEFLPYTMRSIPPQSLDSTPAATCNYHDYQVLKPFAVDSGPIAPWFGQLGYGLQYQLDASLIPGGPSRINVMWLVDNGYLARV